MIMSDYRYILDLMSNISYEETENWKVVKKDYLTPTLISGDLPLEHPQGLFQYCRTIRDNLEEALETGIITEGDPDSYNAPYYVSDLVDNIGCFKSKYSPKLLVLDFSKKKNN